MPTKLKVTPTLRRVVREVFPDLGTKEALRLLEMGLLRIPKNLRCGAYARSTGKPCKAGGDPWHLPLQEPRRSPEIGSGGQSHLRRAEATLDEVARRSPAIAQTRFDRVNPQIGCKRCNGRENA
jgi:hypothetical protein